MGLSRRLSTCGRQFVALAGAHERTITRWSASASPDPSRDAQDRLDVLYALLVKSLEAGVSPRALRFWLRKRNPVLNYEIPLDVIRGGRGEEALNVVGELVFERALGPSKVFPDELSAQATQLNIIKRRTPEHIRFMEYSAAAVASLVAASLTTEGVGHVDLLIRRISDMPEWHLRKRFQPMFEFFKFTASPKRRSGRQLATLSARCYSVGKVHGQHVFYPTMRGRSFNDEYIAMRLYTYDFRPDEQHEGQGKEAEPQIWGHDNPVVVASTAHPEGKGLLDSFNRVWDALWTPVGPLPRFSLPLQEELENAPVVAALGDWAKDLKIWLKAMAPPSE